MKAIAVDDEPMALEIIKSHASKVPFLNLVATFTDAFKAMEYLQNENVDLIFLDIKMPDISGIELFNCLQKKPLLVFTTAFSNYAIKSFEMDAIDYLLKPFSLARFLQACNKAYELFNARNSNEQNPYFFVKIGNEQHKIIYEEIIYVKADGNYVTLALNNKKKLLIRATFAEAINWLPAQKFIRVHRSFIVSVDRIEKIEKNLITIGQDKIPISQIYFEKIKSRLNQ